MIVRVVVDAGVWISAVHFGGTPLRALEHAVQTSIIVVCDKLIDEIVVALRGKFRWSNESIAAMTNDRLHPCWYLVPEGKVAGLCRDPKDDYILDCAVQGDASAILTGDKDLLTMDPFQGIRILAPQDFLHWTPDAAEAD